MPKFLIWLFPLALAMAQHQMAPATETPVTLYAGMGAWHHPIAAKNSDAQKYFDQGLALMYGFNRYESLRSFKKASELDPQAAMPYWGMAMAQGPYINMDGDPTLDLKASCLSAQAGLKVKDAPERERLYLQAVATWCPEYRPPAYIDAMKALSARYPDDLDAATLYADSLMIPVRWHWYTSDGAPAAGVAEAERTLEGVMRRWPDHPGANHYYIHAVESSPTPERAIPSAQRLMGLVPGAGHIVHMPGHIWLVVGDYEMAAAVNERAADVDRQYFAATHVTTGSYPMYYVHNLHFIAYARSMQGRKADALKAWDDVAAAVAPMAKEMPEMADTFASVQFFGHIRFSDWDAILKTPQPPANMVASTSIWHYARALAMAGRKDHAGAIAEQAAFDAARAKIPPDAQWGQSKAADVSAMVSEIIAARVSATEAEAVSHWEKAVKIQDTLVYDEPPAWYYPIRESLGGSLMRAGKAKEAEVVFREGLKRSPRNGRILFGLSESLRVQGRNDDAEAVKREFDAAWAKADVKVRIEEL